MRGFDQSPCSSRRNPDVLSSGLLGMSAIMGPAYQRRFGKQVWGVDATRILRLVRAMPTKKQDKKDMHFNNCQACT